LTNGVLVPSYSGPRRGRRSEMNDDDDRKRGAREDAPPEEGDLLARVSALEAELEKMREDARQSHERWLRERADLENLKKRLARERAETARFANESVLRDLLPIVDNLERAVAHAARGGNGAPLVEGVTLVLKSLLDVLERNGVTRIVAKGTPFDPAQHEAMAHVESADHEPNSVIEEHQPGYRLRERLLRPALVSVAKAPDNLARDRDRD
jgi:molecular chaperone GrpE